MNIFHANCIADIIEFNQRSDQLAIVEREMPQGADIFFKKMMNQPFGIAGKVRKNNAEEDIIEILSDVLPLDIRNDPFYTLWVSDMANICEHFCITQKTEAVGFWSGTKRGCRRYHTDNVPMRLLVTYAGRGTEWLPDEAANREAFEKGASNEEIVKDKSAIRFMNVWDVAVFRGGPEGLLHRTPDDALNEPSVFMRLDQLSFWENVLKHQNT